MSDLYPTPLRRVTLTVVAFAYLLASRDAMSAGVVLQVLWFAMGAGLALLLAEASVAVHLGWPFGRRPDTRPFRNLSTKPATTTRKIAA
jgi:hypothetical protein